MVVVSAGGGLLLVCCVAGGRRVEAQRVLPCGQRRGVHAAPHAPGGRQQAQAHFHAEVFRV